MTSLKDVYVITLLGDVMLGRLIDQMLPQHVNEPEEARHATSLRRSYANLQNYSYETPWGNALPLLEQSDIILGNLETSATTTSKKWPNKVFNYRMHPANIQCLKVAGINYVSLANNHTLDFDKQGLLDTVKTVKEAKIAFAGAGETAEEAGHPAVLRLPRSKGDASDPDAAVHEVHLYSYSDHPRDWSVVPEFNLFNYTTTSKTKLKTALLKQYSDISSRPGLKVVSVHWGPNYSWHPDDQIIEMAHFLIDECGVDIIHGHSSHHIQGAEVYKGKLIVYGCGDFVDDYAVVPDYRNDLSAAWNVAVSESSTSNKLKIQSLEVHPNRITKFQAHILNKCDADYEWVKQKFIELCRPFGTKVSDGDGRILISVNDV